MFDQQEAAAGTIQDYRLPGIVTPERYLLRLTPDLTAFTFDGEETVAIKVHEQTSEIQLNALELEIDRASVERGGKSLTGAVEFVPARERAKLTFPQPLEPGEWTLKIAFRGTLNDKLHGFYRSQYKDDCRQDPYRRGHPVRGHRRAPRLPVLGRARAEGDATRSRW